MAVVRTGKEKKGIIGIREREGKREKVTRRDRRGFFEGRRDR